LDVAKSLKGDSKPTITPKKEKEVEEIELSDYYDEI
jgi:hypothetical protein